MSILRVYMIACEHCRFIYVVPEHVDFETVSCPACQDGVGWDPIVEQAFRDTNEEAIH